MKFPSISALLVVLPLAGCATPSQPYWYHPEVNQHDTETAISRCAYEVKMADKVSKAEERAVVASCMKGQGFRLRR